MHPWFHLISLHYWVIFQWIIVSHAFFLYWNYLPLHLCLCPFPIFWSFILWFILPLCQPALFLSFWFFMEGLVVMSLGLHPCFLPRNFPLLHIPPQPNPFLVWNEVKLILHHWRPKAWDCWSFIYLQRILQMLQMSLYLLELSLWGVTHHGIYFLHRIEICVLMVQFWCFATRFPLDSLNLHFIQCWIYFLLVTILHLVLLLFQACPIFSLGNFLHNVCIHDTFCIWKVFSHRLGFGYGSSHPKKFWWFMESPFLDLLQHRF